MKKFLITLLICCILSNHCIGQDVGNWNIVIPQIEEKVEVKKKVLDKKYWIAVGVLQASTVIDYKSTFCVLNSCKTCYEANPVLRWTTSSQPKMYLIGTAINSGIAIGMWKMKKDGSKIWWIPVVVGTTIHLLAAKHNYSLVKSP